MFGRRHSLCSPLPHALSVVVGPALHLTICQSLGKRGVGERVVAKVGCRAEVGQGDTLSSEAFSTLFGLRPFPTHQQHHYKSVVLAPQPPLLVWLCLVCALRQHSC